MIVTHIQWYPYRVPLRRHFTNAHGTLAVREGAIIEVFVEGHISGIGEIAPMPEFGGETLNEALSMLPSIAADLLDHDLQAALSYLEVQQVARELPASVVCGLEMALLDALGKQEGCSMSTLLAPPSDEVRSAVPVNAVIGAQNIATTVQLACNAVAAGIRCLKLKMGNGMYDEVERVSAVRKAVGSEIHLRLDANEAWSFEQARTILSACEPLTIQYVEQPLRAYDLRGMYQLRQQVSIPIAADEAVYHLESARCVLAWEAADILIVKPQLAGGLRTAQRIIDEATGYHVPCVITSTIETGVGLLGALHLAAALPQISLECGLATLPLLNDDLVVEAIAVQNGTLALPQGPGLGVELDRAALAKYTITQNM
jgi:o-succinylbenzoate synthase